MKQTAVDDPILRQGPAAQHLAVSKSCLRRWDQQGVGPKRVKPPGTRCVLYRLSALTEWASKNEVDPAVVLKSR